MPTVRSAKAKGARLQNWTRDRLRSLFPTLEPDDIKSCQMGSNGADILLSPAGRRIVGLSVECKARAAGFTPVYDALAQATRDGEGVPCAIIRQDRRKALAVVDAELFLELWAVHRGESH